MFRSSIKALALLALATPSLMADSIQPKVQIVDDFDNGVQNQRLGYRNVFQAKPSAAVASRVNREYRGNCGRSMCVSVDRRDLGFCGLWVHFFDFRSPERTYFDSSKYLYLSFWIKGAKGGEDFTVKLADRKWIEKEDAIPLGHINQFLAGGVTRTWREVIIPLNSTSKLNWAELGGLILDFNKEGRYTVYIDDVAFKTHRTIPTSFSRPSKAPKTAAPTVKGPSRKTVRSMWVWISEQLLTDQTKRDEFFATCLKQEVRQIWVQMLYSMSKMEDSSESGPFGILATPKCRLKCVNEWRKFNREAHYYGIKVHALDGYPEFAQKEFHHIPLAVVDALIRFNQAVPPVERFDGVHFDNEPYLIVGWHDSKRRQQILKEFLELNEMCQAKISEHSQMEYGIDIPFWWQERDPKTGHCPGDVTFNGRRKPASFHCIDMLDNVGIMNYRDQADGADGMIAHGRDLLNYADKMNGARIAMGVELFREDPADAWFVTGLAPKDFAEAVNSNGSDFARLSRVDGFRFNVINDGRFIHVGVALPPTRELDRDKLRRTLVRIAKRFGKSDKQRSKADVERISEAVATSIRKDPVWSDFIARPIEDPATGDIYSGFIATSMMLPKTTFADDTYYDFRTQTRAAEEYFGRYRQYQGTAIHCYEQFIKLIGAAQGE
ncbi:MAG: hypothetical protein CMJ78_10710 [Planctomycetaceae bacterium]|nr:hypothetical protein [Planctomycetaceae bacterium]